MTASAYLPDSQSPVLPHHWLVSFLEMGLPGCSVDQRRSPELSPMLNDLSGLPPALFTVGDLDPLRNESILMAQRWQLAGSPVHQQRHPDRAVHGRTSHRQAR